MITVKNVHNKRQSHVTDPAFLFGSVPVYY